MSFLQHIMENIRPVLVGVKGWSYCVFWKISEDQRFLELTDCCCAGSENKVFDNNSEGDDQELLFAAVSVIPCRDVICQHPRIKACELLSQLPSSLPMDSGVHAQTLISNQPRWLNFSNSCHSDILEDAVETRVLVPVSVGLIELFVDKQVSEDQRLIDFIISQFNISQDQQSMMSSNFSFKLSENDQKLQKELFQPPVSPATMIQNLNLQDDMNTDQIHLHNSSMNFFQQFDDHNMENDNKNLLESSNEQLNADHRSFNGYDQEDLDTLQKSMMSNASASVNAHMMNGGLVEPTKSKKRQNDDRDSLNRSDSVSDCSDQNDDEDNNDGKYRRRNGKGGAQCKNLEAERKRRKKLNERLYNLRSLVPKITKLDRASILGDAIEYVMELKQQVEDLQTELERNMDDEGVPPNDNDQSTLQSEVVHGSTEVRNGTKSEHGKPFHKAYHIGASSSIGTEVSTKKNPNTESTNEKVQQMEPQVEVVQLDGNELFVKVFCEHKPGGFVKLMEALNSLGLEVTNVNVTSLLSLVLNVFKVERKECDMIQADHVKESLLELTKNPNRSWPEISKAAASENGNGSNNLDHNNYHQYHHHSHPVHFHHNHHLHHLHN